MTNLINSKSINEIQKSSSSSVNRSYSDYLVKHLQLGTLNPALYQTEEVEDLYDLQIDHVGRIWFTITYNCSTECLIVNFHKIRNLKVSSKKSNNSDCQYLSVKIFLENLERNYQNTTIKKYSSNSDFNEKFLFQVPFSALRSRTLHFFILLSEKDRHGKPVAVSSYQLTEIASDERIDKDNIKILTKARIYRDLSEHNSNQISCCPEICISLKYHSDTHRLNVTIYNVRNVFNNDKGIYVKLKLFKGLTCKEKQSKQTSISKENYIFNESFTFFKIFSLDFISLQITLLSEKTLFGIYDKPIGSATLGSHLFAKGKELSYWLQMVNQPDEHIICWLPLKY